MAFFTANFDAAGSRDQPFVVVAGYIAHHLQWQQHERAWEMWHKQYSLDLPFHMTEFESALSNPRYKEQKNARKDYIRIAEDPKRAMEFLVKLSLAEILFLNCAVTAIIPMDIYNEMDSVLKLQEVIPAYALGARMCIDLVRQWEKTFDLHVPVECVFEKGDFGQGKFSDLMVDEGADLPIYKDKGCLSGLQAADHYAWERSYFCKRVEGKEAQTRPSYDLLVTIPKLHVQATRELLLNVAHMKKIDARTGIRQP